MDTKTLLNVNGLEVSWDKHQGRCFLAGHSVALMWIDSTLLRLMSSVQRMVGTERFLLALQNEGRNSVESDWDVIKGSHSFEEGFRKIAAVAQVAGWGNWKLIDCNQFTKSCTFRIENSWEGNYQHTLGECWGSGFVAGKMAGYCSKLFGINCWPRQVSYLANGDPYDEFVVSPSPKTIEDEIDKLLLKNKATQADMAVALEKLYKEIAQRKEVEKKLSYQATHDPLTGLINRREFERQALELINDSKNNPEKEHTFCFMDLDQFKVLNDTCGHVAGDIMLKQLAEMLQPIIRQQDTISRLGGDEFGILIRNSSLTSSYEIVTKIQRAIQDYKLMCAGQPRSVGVSIGITSISHMTASLTELFKEADIACYAAKDLGRNRIQIYQMGDELLAKRHSEMEWINRIQDALDKNRFCIFAQAIQPASATGKHYELLIRMIDEQGQMVSPGCFLPAAEKYYMTNQIDRWMIAQTLHLMTLHQGYFANIDFVSINLSGHSLTDESFIDFVAEESLKTGVKANKICFEITETAAVSNMTKADKAIKRLKHCGFRFALDDFGSGLCSFRYLKQLPVDYLKIDGMFVKDILNDSIDQAMVKSINDIGHTMGIKTVAEYVETEEIKEMLTAFGIDYLQGYAIGKPMPFEQMITMH